MHRTIRLVGLAVLATCALSAAAWLLAPALVPTYLYYDLIGRWAAPLPPEVEQFVFQSGEEYCGRGHDTECGGYRVVGGRALAVGQAARANGTAEAWCVDYVVLRRNLGRSGALIYWAKIPQALIVTRSSDGRLDSLPVERCATATLE